MKSKLLYAVSILLCFAIMVCLASCGGSGGDSSESTSSKESSVSASSANAGPSYITPKKPKLTSLAQSAAFVQATKIRIMPLGDSLTEGGQHETSAYRGFLSKLLTDGGHNTIFVGSHDWSSQSITDGNKMHSGYGGARIGKISSELDSMAECRPDVVLLMIGRNDCTDSVSASKAVDLLDTTVIDKIYNMFPDTYIFLASPPPMRHWNGSETLLMTDKAINEYAPAYKQYVEQKRAQGCKISYVDMGIEATGLTWQDFTADDFVHPLPGGYEKIANRWYAEINDTLVQIHKDKEAVALASQAAQSDN